MANSSQVILRKQPAWKQAAEQLLHGCSALGSADERVLLFEKLAQSLGNQLYPAFIQVLCVANRSQDDRAKGLLTEALVYALRSGRIPAGKLTAWGAGSVDENSAFGATRSLGPIEYLCVWYAQPCGRELLSETAFRNAAQSLLNLIDNNLSAKKLYCEKLYAEISDPLGGAIASSLQPAMTRFVESWQSASSPEQAINEFISELSVSAQKRLSTQFNPLFGNY